MNKKQNLLVGLGMIWFFAIIGSFGFLIASEPTLIDNPAVPWSFAIMIGIFCAIIVAFGYRASAETRPMGF